MRSDQRAAHASYIAGETIQSLVLRLEVRHGLELSDESRARLHAALREPVEAIVTRCLEQLEAVR